MRQAIHHERLITGRTGIPFALSSPHGGPFDGTQDRRIEGQQVLQLPISGSPPHGQRVIAARSGRLIPRPRADKTLVSAEMQLTTIRLSQPGATILAAKTRRKKTGAEAPVLRAVLIDQRCEYM